MKKVFIILFSLLTAFPVLSQDAIFLHGTVKAEGSDMPVPNHPVFIDTADSLHSNMVFTNQYGYYSDSVLSGNWGISVSTPDCHGVLHTQYLPSPDSITTVDFVICTDTCSLTANFDYEQDQQTPLSVHFNDISEGNPNLWIWDFGDFTPSSSEQNPSHTYFHAGTYPVTLSIFDTLTGCTDSVILPVTVYGDTLDFCHADFTVELDSVSNTPYTYFFTDKSEGNLSHWMWDFGDGSFATQQNPTHVYADSGMYQVCLTVQSNDGGGYCEDTSCQWIETPAYDNFGGQVFVGGYPINVEENDSSNRAVASLYRYYHNQLYLVDQREFWKFGYYWFVQKLEGNYLIRIDIEEGSPLYGHYAPGYYGDAFNWQKSTLFDLNGSDYFAVNVNLQPLAVANFGTGFILGRIYQKENCENFDANHVAVYLFNPSDSLLLVSYTNDKGAFLFSNLPFGNYRLEAEYTGKYSESESVAIDAQNPSNTDVNLGIACSNPNAVFYRKKYSGLAIENLFPIPASNYLHVVVKSDRNRLARYDVYNIAGRLIHSGNLNLITGKNNVTIGVSGYPSGMVLLKIHDSERLLQVERKIIIKK